MRRGSEMHSRNIGRGVVILSIHDWWYHSHGHSDIQLARAFARHMPVLFVNSIGMRVPRRGIVSAPLTRIVRKLRSAGRRFQFPDSAVPNLAVATPASLPIYSGAFSKIISSLVLSQISSGAKQSGTDPFCGDRFGRSIPKDSFSWGRHSGRRIVPALHRRSRPSRGFFAQSTRA